jgi:outer membrane protein TolC
MIHPFSAAPKRAVQQPVQLHLAIGISFVLAGCSSYEPSALNSESIGGRLLIPGNDALVIEAGKIQHPLLRPVQLDASNGVSPDEAAVLAVALNPALRAARDQRGEAQAQLLQAGILPNPQLGTNVDFVTGGTTLGTRTAFGYGLSWDLRSLLTRDPNVASAEAAAESVHLDVAWLEWQTALAAQTALYDVAALNSQVAEAEEISNRLSENAALLKKAADAREKTGLDSAAATVSANDAHAILLGLRQELEQSRIALNRTIGYPPDTMLKLESNLALISHVDPPAESDLIDGLEERRLDLLALKRGYESQDAKLRGAIIAQFPNINLGFNRATDTGNVQTTGPGVTIDLPIFDRNQGNVAIEKATRQRLFDEYTNRVFEARSDIASALVDIRSLNEQIAHARQALPTLREVVDVSRKAVDEGSIDVLAFYSAENDLTQRSIDILKLKQQLARTRIALEAAAAWHLSP